MITISRIFFSNDFYVPKYLKTWAITRSEGQNPEVDQNLSSMLNQFWSDFFGIACLFKPRIVWASHPHNYFNLHICPSIRQYFQFQNYIHLLQYRAFFWGMFFFPRSTALEMVSHQSWNYKKKSLEKGPFNIYVNRNLTYFDHSPNPNW